MHLSTLLLALPAAGALIIALLPRGQDTLARQVALLHAVGALALALTIAWSYDPVAGGVQMVDGFIWSERLHLALRVGVDGLSAVMVTLTSLLFLVALLGSGGVTQTPRRYHAWLLGLQTPTLGVFLARDWTLFYACWELTLVPLFFLVSAWGGPRRHQASLTFLLYTMAGSVFLLNAMLILILWGPGRGGFPVDPTAAALAPEAQLALFLAFLIGFGVKVPLVPLHGWLPLAHVEAPAPVSVLLSGILLKMGAYGLIRAAEALPAGATQAAPVLMGLGVLGAIYGALMAWREDDLKRLVAWSSVSHMGVVLVGIAAASPLGHAAAVLQIVAHGLVAGATFLAVGLIYDRAHTRDLRALGGLAAAAPGLTGFAAVAFLASLGAPGGAGFPAELATVTAGVQAFGLVAGGVVVGGLLWSASALRVVLALAGRPQTEAGAHVGELRPAEWAAAALLVGALLAVGLRPSLVTDAVATDGQAWAARLAAAEESLHGHR